MASGGEWELQRYVVMIGAGLVVIAPIGCLLCMLCVFANRFDWMLTCFLNCFVIALTCNVQWSGGVGLL